MKKSFGLIALSALLSTMAIPQIAFGFCTDNIPAEYMEAARALHSQSVLRGNDQGACNLNGQLNKIEFATLVLRYGYTDEDINDLANMAQGSFPDLQAGVWYEKVAKAAKFEGLIKGEGTNGNGNFGKIVNGAEAHTIILRGAGINIPLPLPGEEWYDPAINLLKQNGFHSYAPNHQMTRGEAVRLINDVGTHISLLENAASNYDNQAAQPNSQPTQPTQPATGGNFKVVSSLRNLAENFDSLSEQQVADTLKTLNETDNLTLSIYSAFQSLAHLKACNADPNLVINSTTGPTNCSQTVLSWQQSLQFANNDWAQATSYAYQNRDQMLIGMKCGTGEIDAGSCTLYGNIQQQNMNAMDKIFREMLDQCTYDGQVLSNGATCVSS